MEGHSVCELLSHADPTELNGISFNFNRSFTINILRGLLTSFIVCLGSLLTARLLGGASDFSHR